MLDGTAPSTEDEKRAAKRERKTEAQKQSRAAKKAAEALTGMGGCMSELNLT